MYTLRRKPGEGPVYMAVPTEGSLFFSMLCCPEEFDFVMKRGWATHDGVKAFVMPEASDRESGFLRLALAEPYGRTR